MKKLIFAFTVAIGIVSFGCQCNCEDTDEYYVKYEVNMDGLVGTPHAEIIISAENGDLTFNIDNDSSWETTIGPVLKGFNATLEVNVSNEWVLLYANLYVSKNDSPFALKASDGSVSVDDPRINIQLSYTIDY